MSLPNDAHMEWLALSNSFDIDINNPIMKLIKTYLENSIRLVRAVAKTRLDCSKARIGVIPDKFKRAADVMSGGNSVIRGQMLKQARLQVVQSLEASVKISKLKEMRSLNDLHSAGVSEYAGLYREVVKIKRMAVKNEWQRVSVNNQRVLRRLSDIEKERRRMQSPERGIGTWREVACGADEIADFARSRNIQLDKNDANIPVYGGVSLDEGEKAILSLPPKYAVSERISAKTVKTDLRKTAVKLRWEERSADVEPAEKEREVIERATYNKANDTVDLSMVRPTDMKNNKRVILPQNHLGVVRETRLQVIENEVVAVARDVESRGGDRRSNLTVSQARGLDKLLKRMKDGEVVIYTTDKSGRLSIDSKENYDRAMSLHTSNMKHLTSPTDTIKRVENESNALSRIWIKMFGLGSGTSQDRRIAGNVTNKFSGPAPLYGLRKDHKLVPEGDEPPMRPVCGACTGPNAAVANLVSTFIDHINVSCRDERWCSSTESMIAEIERFNNTRETRECAIFSLDVKALFPSLDIELCKEVVYNLICDSTVTIKNIDYGVAKKLMWFVSTKEERLSRGIEQFAPTRMSNAGRPPGLTGFFTENPDMWRHSQSRMSPIEERKVLATVVSGCVKRVMANHPVTTGGQVFLQTEGGPIGLDLTCTVARSVMHCFDSKLVLKLRDFGIDCRMNRTYVDDKQMVTSVLPPGVTYRDG